MNSSYSKESANSVAPSQPTDAPTWQVKLLYDGECPLCLREVNFLTQRDAGRGRVKFVDISADDYDPTDHGGIDYETAMGRIHALLPDGTVIRNVEVFRRTYEILGMGWIYAATRLPLLGAIANGLYILWAELRLKLTGRPDLATLVEQRKQRLFSEGHPQCGTEGLTRK